MIRPVYALVLLLATCVVIAALHRAIQDQLGTDPSIRTGTANSSSRVAH